MKEKIKAKAQAIVQNPNAKKALQSIKPQKNFWGIGGVVLFFIVPEIIAYIWGEDITKYANNELLKPQDFLNTQYYELLVMLFEEGISYINLAIGIALLIWLFL
ncbi:hypothetical protein CVO_05490 [Sulfurimonas sp. CVO]|uniref:Uncharacterized protein n=1 Tax=Sulfurimonas xiamenensis TaxID=2590021 RepID=A0AAJ4DMG0_9BACT|nr:MULTISPECIES: hypothetical protein [Sulfurimonas]QFR43132.1 hypothetical protein FJR47_04125 [Sulfurimonas xiamenensis]QHG91323.1 hypothetical protein CVO_05490 [Sulfurimonas sp. CVO]